MPSRMQEYRARMKARGLMQVTVWAKPTDTDQIREYAQSLLNKVDLKSTAPADQQPKESSASNNVTGDRLSPTEPQTKAEERNTSDITGDTPNPDDVTGDIFHPDDLAAATLEVDEEVANWDAELDLVEDLERHEEVLQELRQWLKETTDDAPELRIVLEKHINERRKLVKSLRRAKKRNAS